MNNEGGVDAVERDASTINVEHHLDVKRGTVASWWPIAAGMVPIAWRGALGRPFERSSEKSPALASRAATGSLWPLCASFRSPWPMASMCAVRRDGLKRWFN